MVFDLCDRAPDGYVKYVFKYDFSKVIFGVGAQDEFIRMALPVSDEDPALRLRITAAALGVLVVVLAQKGGMKAAPFLMTGLLGGFTTFSAFYLDAFTLYERGQTGVAVVYVAASVLISIAALVAGILVTRALTQ